MSRYPESVPYWERWCLAEEVAEAIGVAMGAPCHVAEDTLDGYVVSGALRKRMAEGGRWEYAPVPPPEQSTNKDDS